MKKPVTIVAFFLVLLAVIGFERIGRKMRILISDDRTARERGVSEPPGSSFADTLHANQRGNHGSTGDSRLANSFKQRDLDGNSIGSARLTETPGLTELNLSVTGEISPVHVIRSSEILASTEPSEEEIALLRRSVDAIADGLNPGAIILDADAIGTRGNRGLLYAREGLDLTAQMKAVYDASKGEPELLSEPVEVEAPSVEQAAAPPEP